MHVLFLVKGTRGDVQPAAVLAQGLQALHPELTLHFVTHLDHKRWLAEVLQVSDTCLFLSTLPARQWDIQVADEQTARNRTQLKVASEAAKSFQSDADLEESIAAIQRSLELAQPAQQATAKDGHLYAQRTLIIFNLFSMEALHIAEALEVPCLAISPTLVPYTFPTSFPRRFQKAWSALHDSLQCAPEGQVNWAEVEHWLWPAFSHRWTVWRRHRLGLSPAPFACSTKELHSCNSLHMNAHHHTNADNPSSKPTADEMPDRIATSGNPLSNSAGTSATNPLDSEPPPGSSPNCSSYSGNHVLPSSVPLLYGLSEQVVTRPGYWPNSVHCCGFWQQEGVCKDCDRQQQLQACMPPLLHQFILATRLARQPLVCIDFGSMGHMGLITDPHHLVSVLTTALQTATAKGILLTGGWQPLLLAASVASARQQHPVLIAAAESIPHHLLLPECSAVVHHGGAGTSAATLLAGLPHITCPFHFDQFNWADRLAYLGVALQCSSKDLAATSQQQDPSTSTNRHDIQPHGHSVSPDGQPGPSNGQLDHLDWQPRPHHAPQPVTATCAAHVTAPAAAAAQGLSDRLKIVLSGCMRQQCQEIQAQLAKEEAVKVAVDIISQVMQHAAVPAEAALVSPMQASPSNSIDEPEPSRRNRQRREFKAQEPDPQSTPTTCDMSGQAFVQLPNGWSVPARSQVEALFIYKEIVEEQCYLQQGIQINDGDTVLDVGANIGLFSWWVMQGGPGRGVPARVWAVEPMPSNVTVLQANLKQHGMANQVHVIPQAVGHGEGQLMFRYYPAMPGNSTCHVQEKEQLQRGEMADYFFEGSQDCMCPVTTISILMDKCDITQIDLLKVDVEGCELQALQGIQPEHWAHVQQIVLEVHDTAGRLEQIKNLLEAQHYELSSIQGLAPNTHMVYARKLPSKASGVCCTEPIQWVLSA